MVIEMPEGLMPHQQSDWFENLSLKDRQSYVRSQTPWLVNRKCVIPAMKEKYGPNYWAYQLANGWRFYNSSSKEETEAKYNEFMNRTED